MIRVASILLGLPLAVAAQQSGGSSAVSNPIVLLLVLAALALLPFVLIMLTSFVKIAVVLSILRSALGTQQVPPNQIITGLAFVLSIFVMVPVGRQMYAAATPVSDTRDIFSEASVRSLYDAGQRGREPLRRFLARHSHDKDRILFMELAARLDRDGQIASQPPATPPAVVAAASPDPAGVPVPAAPEVKVDKDEFRIIIPAFVTSELKEAFQVGFLVFVPFIIIDMVVANILLAMGMSMLSPSVVSLPFKLLLFVLVDGWYLILKGLVLSYA